MNYETEQEHRNLMYLLVKNIPAQKLPIHKKIIHFWDMKLLGTRTTSPLLFQVIASKLEGKSHWFWEQNRRIRGYQKGSKFEEDLVEKEWKQRRCSVLKFSVLVCLFVFLCATLFLFFALCSLSLSVFAGKGSWIQHKQEDFITAKFYNITKWYLSGPFLFYWYFSVTMTLMPLHEPCFSLVGNMCNGNYSITSHAFLLFMQLMKMGFALQ